MTSPESKVSAALEACRALLSPTEYREVSDLNAHSESGVAIEVLTDFLGEKGAIMSDAQLRTIEEAFTLMNMQPGRRTEYLRELRQAQP